MNKQNILRVLAENNKIIRAIIAALRDTKQNNLAGELIMVANDIAIIQKEISDKTFYEVKQTEE